jgi:hypothetical protein
MDLFQTKLSKSEWIGIEKPVNEKEMNVMNIIKNGWINPTYKSNDTKTIASYIKIAYNDTIDYFIYDIYLKDTLMKYMNKYSIDIKPPVKPGTYKMNKSDTIRFKNMEVMIRENDTKLYEFFLMNILCKMLKHKHNGMVWESEYYTLYNLSKCSIVNCNKILTYYVNNIIEKFYTFEIIKKMIYNSYLLEKDTVISEYSDNTLYTHQMDIFIKIKENDNPKLILYTAPTGTGKTLTPIGISEGKRVVFVCAARHVGIELARYCISSGKKIAIAFDCQSEHDIRLHYFAAKDFIRDTKSGKIRSVDNTNGVNVDIIICDIGSCIYSMEYILRFNEQSNTVLYWDEPTITMDYDKHVLHEKIHNIWIKNRIHNVVLSSATLPQPIYLGKTIDDFKRRFGDESSIIPINSRTNRKSIPLIGPDGMIYVPHYLFKTHMEIMECVEHCKKKPMLLPYMDISEVSRFIQVVHYNFMYYCKPSPIDSIIKSMEDLTVTNIKLYYLYLLENVYPDKWDIIYKYMNDTRKMKYPATLHITTNDSHTLTHGPTIYIAEDVEKISNYCLKDSNIPSSVLDTIMTDIKKNNSISKQIKYIECKIEDKTMRDIISGNDKKLTNQRGDTEVTELRDNLKKLVNEIRPVKLPSKYIPNTYDHLSKYIGYVNKDSFTCDISDEITEKIMLMDDVDNKWKLLLLMGIGVFMNFNNTMYMDIMKELALHQKLYLIIAGQDFIYGTNYQFCHGYISNDLSDMTQEKLIQAIGRVGRNKISHVYTIRFRNVDTIKKIFRNEIYQPEILKMEQLFNSVTV